MSTPESSVPDSLSPSPDYLSPPPRPVELSARARWMRAGFLSGLVLGPLFVLWMGESSAENLRQLVTQGQTTTGQVLVRC